MENRGRPKCGGPAQLERAHSGRLRAKSLEHALPQNNLIPVTLGNIVAGSLCVATIYSLACECWVGAWVGCWWGQCAPGRGHHDAEANQGPPLRLAASLAINGPCCQLSTFTDLAGVGPPHALPHLGPLLSALLLPRPLQTAPWARSSPAPSEARGPVLAQRRGLLRRTPLPTNPQREKINFVDLQSPLRQPAASAQPQLLCQGALSSRPPFSVLCACCVLCLVRSGSIILAMGSRPGGDAPSEFFLAISSAADAPRFPP